MTILLTSKKFIMKSIAAILFLYYLLFTGCKKDVLSEITTNAWFTNTAIGVTGIKVNPGRNVPYSSQGAISYNSSRMYALPRNAIQLKVVNAADTTISFYHNTINFKSGLYSFFLAGN